MSLRQRSFDNDGEKGYAHGDFFSRGFDRQHLQQVLRAQASFFPAKDFLRNPRSIRTTTQDRALFRLQLVSQGG